MTSTNFKGLLAGATLAAAAAFSGGAASAATIAETITGNDCAGVFGRPFADCETPDAYGNSPIIAKFTPGATSPELNTGLFSTIDGTEFTLSYSASILGGDTDTVTWSYAAGVGDPDITAVAVKYSNQFDLWYDGGSAITGGTFTTSTTQDISHVSFYDSTGGGTNVVIPLPAGLPLILTGLGVLGALGLRKRKTA